MRDITVSVMCIAYNHAKYLRKCLDGFVQQRANFHFEVLVHDDASTDATASIIREYAVAYPEIIKPIYQTENQYSKGISITREIVFPKCQGRYIAICEGDDFWTDPYKLQKQVDALEANPDCSMCVCTVEGVSEDGSKHIVYIPSFSLEEGVIESETFLNIILKNYAFQTSSYMFCASFFKEFAENTPEFAQVCPVGDIPYMLYFGYKGNVFYCKDNMSSCRQNSMGSFTERMRLNKEKRILHRKGMANTFASYDSFTEGRFHKQCLQRIYREKYLAADSPMDFMKLLTAKERMFFEQPLVRKIRILTGAFCYPLLKWKRQILRQTEN